MTRRALLTAVTLVLALAAAPAGASAATFLPPDGKVLHGVAGSNTPAGFAAQTGRAPGVFQLFVAWDDADWAFRRGREAAPARLMLHLSTYAGPGTRERITPAQIAAGHGDAFLVRLNRRIAEHGAPVYLRVMSEMNQWRNPYAGFDAAGRPKPGHAPAEFRQAWRRIALVVRGGPDVDARLARLGMPGVGAALVPAPVALLWVPQVAGSPDTRPNAARAYWPGPAYVDWVGTDFYSKFPNWRGLERFHREFRGHRKPFAFGEYAVWGRDDPAFLRRLFAWTRAHRDVRMLVYNQGNDPAGPFRLAQYPRSLQTLSGLLAAPAFAP